MANKRIKDLPNEATPAATDRIAIDGATTRSTELGEGIAALLSGTALSPAQGGTGIASYTIGDLIYASGVTTLSQLAGIATGNVLRSGGVGAPPAWGKVNLSTDVTGSPSSLTIAMGADNATGLTIQGAGGNSRLTIGTDPSSNALIRTANSGEMRFGVNTTNWYTLNSSGVLAAQSTGAFQGPTIGVATNSNASAGQVGEHVSSTIVSGAAVALTTATSANVTSISLTAGDWDVWVNARFTGGATTTVTILQAGISTTSATLSTTPGQVANTFHNGQAPFASTTLDIPVGAIRMSLASTTTVYFVASATFATSTCSAFGIIQARRRR